MGICSACSKDDSDEVNTESKEKELDLEDDTYISPTTQYLVSGYIHKFAELQQPKNNIITKHIIQIILSFYLQSDYFDRNLSTETVEISHSGKVAKPKPDVTLPKGTVYGSQVISSSKDASYIWRLKIASIKTAEVDIFIGIDNAEAMAKNINFFDQFQQKAWYAYRGGHVYYAYVYGWDVPKKQVTHTFKAGDILTMRLEFGNSSTLSYQINDGNEFIAVSNVKRHKSLKYRLAVSMCYGNFLNCIQILEFNKREKKIYDAKKYLIAGYIRKNFIYQNIPNSLQQLLANFYFVPTVQDLKEKYNVGSKLKLEGGHSVEVRQCKRRSDGKLFAVKIIKYVPNDDGNYGIDNEIHFLSRINHPNIVNYSKRHVYCILDLLEGGELLSKIFNDGKLDEKLASTIFKQILCATCYLHKNGIAHRCITVRNVLFVTKSFCQIKLVSFDVAGCIYDSNKNGCFRTPCGSEMSVAPEVLKKEPYTTQCDLWGCGVTLYSMLSGATPWGYGEDNTHRMYEKIKNGQYEMGPELWDNISNNAKDLVRKLLNVDPKQRLTATQALKHPFIES